VTLDPEHTREEFSDVPRAEIERRVLAFVAEQLRVNADGRALALRARFESAWSPERHSGGDRVELSGALPRETRELAVWAGPRIKAIVVSARDGARPVQNLLIKGGDTGAPFRLGNEPLDARWSERTAEELLARIDAFPAPKTGVLPAQPVPVVRGVEARRESGFAPESAGAVFTRFVGLGFTHIVPAGLDHLLFVLGVVLGSPRDWRRLVLWLSAFTLAHSITLALVVVGVVGLPGAFVEPAIALSIAYVGVENLLRRGRVPSSRAALTFGFGLLHGLGFAGALVDAGLPREHEWLALAGFNLGVEGGQLVVLAALVPLLALVRDRDAVWRFIVVPGSLLVAGAGLLWAALRLFG
jgi:hydrogenase/urease accessory protein HupE